MSFSEFLKNAALARVMRLGANGTLPAAEAGAVRGVALAITPKWNNAAAVDLGDSYAANGYTWSATTKTPHVTQCRGRTVMLNMVLGAPWRMIYPRCLGGTRTEQWIDGAAMTYGGLSAALTDDAYHVLVSFPTNDVGLLGGTYSVGPFSGQTISAATIISSLKYIADAILAAGKLPWLTVGGISGIWASDKLAAAATINAWVNSYARANGLPWIDEQTIADPSTGALTSTYAYNEGGSQYVHPSGVGSLRRALLNRDRVAPFVKSALVAEPFRKSLIVNPLFANLTSGIPASWTAYSSNAGTPARTAPSDALSGWQTVFTAAAANGADGLQQSVTLASAGLAAGDTIQAVLRGQIVSATAGVTPRIYMTFTGSTGDYTYVRANNRISPDGNLLWSPNSAENVFTVSTVPVAIPPGTTALALILAFEADNGAVVTARMFEFDIVKR